MMSNINEVLSVNCGDWHLGWGFGGNDKIGKLYDNEDGTYTWKGKSQGRHGRVWNRGATATFKVDDNGKIKIISQKGSIPVESEILSAVDQLRMIAQKRSNVDMRRKNKERHKSPGSPSPYKQGDLFGECNLSNHIPAHLEEILAESGRHRYELHYTQDNIRGSLRGNNPKQMIEQIQQRKGVSEWALYKNDTDFHGTHQDEFLVTWWSRGGKTYWDNRGRNEPEVMKKKWKERVNGKIQDLDTYNEMRKENMTKMTDLIPKKINEGTGNFYNNNASYIFAVGDDDVRGEPDPTSDDDSGDGGDLYFEYETWREGVRDRLEEEIPNFYGGDMRRDQPWNDNRNFSATVLGEVSTDNVEYDDNEYGATIQCVVRSGYYEGANLDWDIRYSLNGDDEYESLQDFDLPSEIESKIKGMVDELVNKIEAVYAKHTTKYRVTARFSSGETHYGKVDDSKRDGVHSMDDSIIRDAGKYKKLFTENLKRLENVWHNKGLKNG